jgi:pyruvate dehydrogenase E2 component (dihydrolipoamide acetyltransferase)
MAEVILMPRLSDTMTEGVIAAWHKKVGDPVKKGELLAEIETDKATMELESYKEGTLLHIGGDKGSKIQVDELLAIIGKPGEDISKHTSGSGAKGKPDMQKAVNKETDTSSDKAEGDVPSKQTSMEPSTSGRMDVSKMEEVVLMPRLSDTMTEGVVASWHKKVGDTVKKGEVLADIETDKATMELESYKNGTLL